ncbi:MAG: hypothetical protein ER33_08145 [Cyanobium sp. CACIAM 14]|nr:MAG: hypothetical protein ER33_08145 [Cyanobium sp. CACIAM 14]
MTTINDAEARMLAAANINPEDYNPSTNGNGKAPRPEDLSHEERLELVHARASELLERKVPVTNRIPLLRAFASDHHLRLIDKELAAAIWKARRDARGPTDAVEPGEDLGAEPDWLWVGLLLVACFNLLVGLPKSGKTSVIVDMIARWAEGATEYLGQALIGPCPPVLLVGVDMPSGDWTRLLRQVGLIPPDSRTFGAPIVGLFHKGRPLTLDPEGIEKIADYAERHPRLLILLDSYAELVKGLGLEEKDADFAEPMSDLMEAVAPFGSTLVLVHHAGKAMAGGNVSLASRGTTALPGLSSQNLGLAPACRNENWWEDRRRILSSDGRGGEPVNLLVERVDGVWHCLGSPVDMHRQMRVEAAEEKLNDRQYEVLALVREQWAQNQRRTTAAEAAAALRLRGKPGQDTAHRILNQLFRKGVLDKVSVATLNGRQDVFWPVGEDPGMEGP